MGAMMCAALTLSLAACAGTPVPQDKIAVAQASVKRAEQAGAPQTAPVQMAAAREKLARAEKAAADKDGKPATLFAEQANADAQLAEATAQQQRARKSAQEFDASMQALKNEANRNTDSSQTNLTQPDTNQ
jgi:hypothetical protein